MRWRRRHTPAHPMVLATIGICTVCGLAHKSVGSSNDRCPICRAMATFEPGDVPNYPPHRSEVAS